MTIEDRRADAANSELKTFHVVTVEHYPNKVLKTMMMIILVIKEDVW